MSDALSLLHPKTCSICKRGLLEHEEDTCSPCINSQMGVGTRTGPSIAKGQSKQDYSTPVAFIRAVEKRFGPLRWDLACTEENKKAPYGITSSSLEFDWVKCGGLCFLNPPFSNITPWAKKCAEESAKGARILFLVPSSTGANWFRDWVWGHADIYYLNGRLTFEGCTDPYPKDLILADYHRPPSYHCTRANMIWDWKKDLTYGPWSDTPRPSSTSGETTSTNQ